MNGDTKKIVFPIGFLIITIIFIKIFYSTNLSSESLEIFEILFLIFCGIFIFNLFFDRKNNKIEIINNTRPFFITISYLIIFLTFPVLTINFGWNFLIVGQLTYLIIIPLTVIVLSVYLIRERDFIVDKILGKMIFIYILMTLSFYDGGDGDAFLGVDVFYSRFILGEKDPSDSVKIIPNDIASSTELITIALLLYFIILNFKLLYKFKKIEKEEAIKRIGNAIS